MKRAIKVKKFISDIFLISKIGFKISPWIYSLKFFSSFLVVFLPVAEAYFASMIIGELVSLVQNPSLDQNNLWVWVTFAIATLVAKGINDHFYDYLQVRYNQLYNYKIYSDYLERLSNLDVQYFDDPDFNTLQAKMYDVISWRLIAVINRTHGLVNSFLGLIFVSYIFSQVNPFFIILIIIPIICNFLINIKFGTEVFYIWEYGGEEAKHITKAFNSFNDKSVVTEAKIYGFGQYLVDIYRDFSRRFMNKHLKTSNRKYSLLSLIKVFEVSGYGFIQINLLQKVLSTTITIQNYTFNLQNIFLISNNFNGFQDNLAKLIELNQYTDSYIKFINLSTKIHIKKNPKSVVGKPPVIEFKNVSFKYPNSDRFVLNNVSFLINSGERVALVGENGAGKTTLIKLLARFYDATEGEILINGINIKDINLKEYYELWGILFQNFARYWFSVRENISLGNINLKDDLEKIIKSSKSAGSHEFISKLEKGYETILDTEFEGGTELSGGQWQKIGIARGLFSSPKLIVLDEPTSAIDAISEKEIFENIFSLPQESTMVIVSHRFSTVRNAHRILVLDSGKIIEQGSHETLMSNRKLYYKMFMSQATGYLD